MSCGEPDRRLRMILIRESECSKKTLSSFTGLPLDNIYLSHWMITSVIWSYFAGEDNCRAPCLILCPSMTLPTSEWSSYVSLNKYKLAVSSRDRLYNLSSLVGYLEAVSEIHLVWGNIHVYKGCKFSSVRDLVIWRARMGFGPFEDFCLCLWIHI